jgi:hypothetical protein
MPDVFGTVLETIPYPEKYLRIDKAEVAGWRGRLAGVAGLKVGLVWAGSGRQDVVATRRNNANRSITLNHYAPLFEVPGVAFVSLQVGPEAAQTAGHDIHDWTDELTDFAATGALIEALDLVITVDTAVAHLAAALGKTVWILVPWVSCWRWLENRTDSPWYGSVTLFRQSERGNWNPVLEAVARDLRAFPNKN